MTLVIAVTLVAFTVCVSLLARVGESDRHRVAAEREAHLLRMEVARLHGERVKERSKR
ncbi:hypothetical protein ACUH93_00630 [Dermabacteraceae bacterium P7006]